MTEKIISFPPIMPAQPKVLILGSVPSGMSLEKQEYYGNPRNHFWRIIFELFDAKMSTAYHDKIAFIRKRHIALWDSIGTCDRKGSLDMHIKEETPNDILGLLHTHPSIRLIACNGTKSYQTFLQHFSKQLSEGMDVIKLPSTSPIPGRYTKTFEGKVEAWKQILDYL